MYGMLLDNKLNRLERKQFEGNRLMQLLYVFNYRFYVVSERLLWAFVWYVLLSLNCRVPYWYLLIIRLFLELALKYLSNLIFYYQWDSVVKSFWKFIFAIILNITYFIDNVYYY